MFQSKDCPDNQKNIVNQATVTSSNNSNTCYQRYYTLPNNSTVMFKPPFLQPYKGKATRHTCPACGAKESFTLYISGETNELINCKVGKCNRESKCGYHYTPKQFYLDNPELNETTKQVCDLHFSKPFVAKQQISLPVGTIPFSYVERSASYQSNFVRFLCELLTTEQISSIGDKYALGATKN